jgi:SRR1
MLQDKVVAESPHDIICYGVGSIQESKSAQYQFVLALLMRDLLKVCGSQTLRYCQDDKSDAKFQSSVTLVVWDLVYL